jgi:hypothetical protein
MSEGLTYVSSTFGRVMVRPVADREEPGYGVTTPADLEDLLLMLANRGHRLDGVIGLHADAYRQFASRLDGMTLARSRLTDDQLRAECARRDIQTAAQGVKYIELAEYDKRAAERDEWKRRAEAAEQSLRFVSDGKRAPRQTKEMLAKEQGPGLTALPPCEPANADHYVDPWDFLEDA